MAQAVAVRLNPAELLARLRGSMLWLTGFSGAFVFMEPSAYEVVALLTMGLFFATGLPLRARVLPLVLLLVCYGIGLTIGLVPVLGRDNTLLWTLVSWFLIATAVFYACALADDTGRRLNLLLAGYTAAAAVVSILAILAYFRLIPGAESMLLYGRAKGTFNDPNVLGPFLILPALLALRSALTGRGLNSAFGGMLLGLFSVALLLSFSRGAWAHFAMSAAIYVGFLLAISKNRARIVFAGSAAIGLAAIAVAILLSTQTVGELFQVRATLEQTYDLGYLGRFGRQMLGALLALDHPFGIGPLQFSRYFPGDPHNVYLNAFMAGGWIAGICYLLLVALTLYVGFKGAWANTPWRPVLLAVYATFVGVTIEGAIIDTDHWRHFWLLLGVLWGGAIAALRVAPARARSYSSAARSVAQPG
jgi:hypothetical protein